MKNVEMIRSQCAGVCRHALQRLRYYVSTLNGGQPEVVDLLSGEAGLNVLESTVEHVMGCLGEVTEKPSIDTVDGASVTRRIVRKGLRTRGARAHPDPEETKTV